MKTKLMLVLALVPIFIFIIVIVLNDKNFGGTPYKNPTELAKEAKDKEKLSPPTTKVDVTKDYRAILKTTYGNIEIKINAIDTPITATNFIYLSKLGFYNNTIFHRVIKDFMIQGGDPKGDGTGGPGYTFKDELLEGEYERGVVAMANAGPNTNGSQFFIMHKSMDLPKSYVIFGKVINGMDVVDKIANVPVEGNKSGEISKPINPMIIESVEIIEGQ
ncbi:MAG: peptidylprolyl isomerase [Patescibacteria group bacterium]